MLTWRHAVLFQELSWMLCIGLRQVVSSHLLGGVLRTIAHAMFTAACPCTMGA